MTKAAQCAAFAFFSVDPICVVQDLFRVIRPKDGWYFIGLLTFESSAFSDHSS